MEYSTRHRRAHLFCRTPLSRSFRLARALRFEPLEDRRVLAVLTVDTGLDVVNLNDGLTSLREAIFAANIVPGADEIVFDISTRPSSITLTQGELKITDSLKITGPGTNLLMIDASGSDPTPNDKTGDGSRVFHVANGTDVQIDVEIAGLHITGGDIAPFGGGIWNWENLVVRDCLINGNYSIHGGGIFSRGRLQVIDSIVSGNTAGTGGGRDPFGGYGGGIFANDLILTDSMVNQNTGRLGAGIMGGNIEIRRSEVFVNYGTGVDASGELLIVDSTIADNKARGISTQLATGTISNSTISGNLAGGLVAFGGNIEVEHSTITGNAMRYGTGGGIESVALTGNLRVHSSIIAGNIGRDVSAQTNTIVSEGYNLIGVGTAVGAFNQAGDQTGVTDPLLGPLAYNGGPTRNHALRADSPAVNTGDPNVVGWENGVPEFDQRGEPFNRIFGSVIDIGSFEWQPLVVDTLEDDSDGDYSEGDFSLREAIELAGQIAGGDTIQFDPSLAGGTILLTLGHLNINSSLEIIGLGADQLAIDASGNDPTPDVDNGDGSRVFWINDTTVSSGFASVTIAGLTITGGDSPTSGGGIASSENLLLREVIVTGNSMTGSRQYGGGISQILGTLTLIDSQVIDNRAVNYAGGGIYVERSQLGIINSTIGYNYAELRGGGIEASGTDVAITDSIIEHNSSDGRGGGISTSSSNFSMQRSTVRFNASEHEGGGVSLSGQSLQIRDSTIHNNTSLLTGGGVSIVGGNATILQSTISNNTATNGSAVSAGSVSGSVSIRNSTITDNTSTNADAGAIFLIRNQLNIDNTIVAGNIDANSAGDIFLHTSSEQRTLAVRNSIVGSNLGTNLVESPVGSSDANGNIIGSGLSGLIDPLLGPLADNGGPTWTHALLPGSPAIDAGDPTSVGGENGVPLFDQRNGPFTRVFGDRIDIGAFEAQSLIVDTLVDENDGDYSHGDFSLREAIALANRIEGENTVEFASSLSGGRILLTMGELKITDHVQIVGLGADQLTVDAQWMSRVIHVDGGMGTTTVPGAVDVVIRGITLTNGVAPNDFSLPTYSRSKGAGICFISSGHLYLDDVVVKGNRAFGTNAAGAGVYVTRGTTTITNSQFLENRCVNANNQPFRGAGIASDNDVSVSDSVFSNNIGTVIHVTRNFGSDSADVLLLRTEISNNNGMALLAEGVTAGTVQVVQSTINRNTRGGILAWNGLLSVTDSFVTNNGGDVGSSSGLSTGGDIAVIRSTVSGNRASGGGGLWGGRHIVVTDSFITDNHNLSEGDRYGGGGIFQYSLNTNVPGAPIPGVGTLSITRSVISNNTSAGDGGGIDTNALVTVTDSTIANNHAMGRGGGIFGEHQSSITLLRSTVDGNTAIGLRQTGAGIYSYGDVAVKYSTISNNRGTGTQATFGGIVAKEVTLLNATISGNGRGGIRATTIDARHSTITRNTGTGLYASSVSLDHTIVAGNIFSSQYESDVQAQNLIARYSQISVGAQYLGSLANNGGPTKTHALLSGSPARDGGDPNLQPGKSGVPEFDQRGAPYTRKYGGRVDVGAYEVQLSGGTYYGDFDFDGDVDGRDFLIWQRGFGASSPVGQDDGDATGDGDVDGNDLAVWQATYGPRPGPRIVDFVLSADEPALINASAADGATAALPSNATSDVDAAFDDWPVQRRTSTDFGEMATRRKALRAWRR